MGQEKARRWNAFVCPDCRFIFRVPGDHEGLGIICPSCRRMLRIPGADDETPSLVMSLQGEEFSEEEEVDHRLEKRRRGKRKKKAKESAIPTWDTRAGRWKLERSDKITFKMGVLGLALFSLASAAFVFFFWDSSHKTDETKVIEGDVTGSSEISENTTLLQPELIENDDSDIELPSIMKRSQAEFLSNAEPLAEKFLNARSVEEILPLIRDGEKLRDKLLSYYPDGRIEPVGMSKFNASGTPMYKDHFGSVDITTEDYEQRFLAFLDGEKGLEIDWESWIGWSDMPWEDILEKRPKVPVLVRVRLKWVDYYNYEFSNEREWRSYRLVSPDGETTLFGYVPRNSLIDQQIRPNEQGVTETKILKIRFSEGSATGNQVIIDELVADGWLLSE